MRNKTLLIATLVLGLVALALLRLNREDAKPDQDKQPLVDDAVLTSLRSLTVKAGGKSATIVKAADGAWTVKDKFGLPADVENRLTPLIRSLQKAGNYGLLTANAKRLEKLGLADSSLTLDADGGKSVSIEFGKQTEDGLGSSARLQGQVAAIRTDFTGYLEGDPTSWVDFTLYATKPEEIKSAVFLWADGKKEFTRPEKAKPFAGKDAASVEEITGALATLRAADAVAKDDKEAAAAFAKSYQVRLGFFDGSSLTLTFAKLAGKTPNDQAKAFVRVSHSDPKHKANAYASKAEFTVPSWILDQVPGSAAEFAKKGQPPAETPAIPTIQLPAQGPTISVPAPK
jgi:hypothetical protein